MSTDVELNNNNSNNKQQQQQKNSNLNPKLKLTIRHLPPTLPEEVFKDSIKPYLTDEKDVTDQRYIPGKVSKKLLTPSRPSRATINFETIQKLIHFKNQFQNHIYVDQQGVEFKIQIIFSPVQQSPKADNNKPDPKLNTLETDPEFIKFCNKIHNEGDKNKTGGNGNEIQLGAQQSSLNATEANKKSTPLLEYLKAKKMGKTSKNKFKPSAILKGENSQDASKPKSSKKSKKERTAKQSQASEEASSSAKPPKSSKLKKKKAKVAEDKSADSKNPQSKTPKEFKIAKKADSTTSPQVEKIVLAKRQESSTLDQGEKPAATTSTENSTPKATNSPTAIFNTAKLAQRSDKPSYKPAEAKASTIDSKSTIQTGEGTGNSTTSPLEKSVSTRRARKGKTLPSDQATSSKQGDRPIGESSAAQASSFPKKGKKTLNSTIADKPVFLKTGTNVDTKQSSETNNLSSPRQIINSQDSSKKLDSLTGLPNNPNSETSTDKPVTGIKFKIKPKPKASKPKGGLFGSKFGGIEGSSDATSSSSSFKPATESSELGSTATKPPFKKSSYKPLDESSQESRGPKPPRVRDTAPRFGPKPGQSEESQDTFKPKPKKYRPKPDRPLPGSSTGPQSNA